VAGGNTLVWSEDLAYLDKLAYEGWMMGGELLDRPVVKEIPEITKDEHSCCKGTSSKKPNI
jgi:hypothetical protein